MARGKYGAKAERRNELAAVERRAESAELARDKAESALSSYREQAQGEIGRLKEQLRIVTAERDRGQGPEAARQESINEDLRQQIAVLRRSARWSLEDGRAQCKAMHEYLITAVGLTAAEAQEVIISFECIGSREERARRASEGDAEHVRGGYVTSVGPSQRHNRDAMVKIDVARGVRSPLPMPGQS